MGIVSICIGRIVSTVRSSDGITGVRGGHDGGGGGEYRSLVGTCLFFAELFLGIALNLLLAVRMSKLAADKLDGWSIVLA